MNWRRARLHITYGLAVALFSLMFGASVFLMIMAVWSDEFDFDRREWIRQILETVIFGILLWWYARDWSRSNVDPQRHKIVAKRKKDRQVIEAGRRCPACLTPGYGLEPFCVRCGLKSP